MRRAPPLLLAAALSLAGCEAEAPPRTGGGGAEDPDRSDAAGEAAVDSAALHRDIDSMLAASAAAWNAGDLEGFLSDYSSRPGMTFLGASGRIRGIDEVRDRYRRSYWGPGSARDSLRFEDVEVVPLGADRALATGRYVLHRPEEDGRTTATGWFTLVLEQEAGEWRIIHDHSS